MALIVQQAVSSAMEPVMAKLQQQGAELHRLRQEVRDKNRADNKVNDAKYRSDWLDRSQGAPSPDDAEAKGA